MRRPIVWLLGGALFLVPPAARADEWDSRDVEAAEHYRETERERASRYRDSIASRSQRVARASRDQRPRPAARAPQRTPGTPSWWDSLVRAGVAEQDLRTLTGWTDGLGRWASFWQNEVQPRWQRWRTLVEPKPAPSQAVQGVAGKDAPPPFFAALGAKLVHGFLAEIRHEAQRD
jgi:hypothetical protein